MSTTTAKKSPWPQLELAVKDGRRKRSNVSRRRIIEALFDLIAEGNMAPSAADVAERANVGLRTVFRHFEDMDSIYNEMTENLMEFVRPKIEAPFKAEHWRARLSEMVERRADVYEFVFPLRVCMILRYHQSEFIRKQYERDVALERSTLNAILPKALQKDRTLFAAIELILSFPTWRRLRQDQNLSDAKARETVHLMLSRLIVGIDEV